MRCRAVISADMRILLSDAVRVARPGVDIRLQSATSGADSDGRVYPTIDDHEQRSEAKARAVLLIDDNAIQAATRQTILRRSGYFAIAALNPKRALEQFQHREFPAEISAVITDHIMPGMNGAEFVRELRKTHPDVPVMVISGLEEAQCEYAGMRVRFLVKPLSPDLLLSNLRDLIAEDEQGAA